MPTDNRKKRRQRDKRTIERFKKRMIREGRTTCHICGGRIDLDAPQYDPESFEADHIRPVAFSDARSVRYQDLAPSHRRCNQKRGVKSVEVARAELQGVAGIPLPAPGEYVKLADGSGWLNSSGGVSSRPW